jgi:hypothetical protein
LKCEDWERRKKLGAMPAGLERQLRAFIALPFRSLEDTSLRERPGFRIEIVDRVARQPKNLGHQRRSSSFAGCIPALNPLKF